MVKTSKLPFLTSSVSVDFRFLFDLRCPKCSRTVPTYQQLQCETTGLQVDSLQIIPVTLQKCIKCTFPVNSGFNCSYLLKSKVTTCSELNQTPGTTHAFMDCEVWKAITLPDIWFWLIPGFLVIQKWSTMTSLPNPNSVLIDVGHGFQATEGVLRESN